MWKYRESTRIMQSSRMDDSNKVLPGFNIKNAPYHHIVRQECGFKTIQTVQFSSGSLRYDLGIHTNELGIYTNSSSRAKWDIKLCNGTGVTSFSFDTREAKQSSSGRKTIATQQAIYSTLSCLRCKWVQLIIIVWQIVGTYCAWNWIILKWLPA